MELQKLTIKIAGESGQGVNSLGEMILEVLNESNYNVFGYREYPSLIRGGYASYQIDFGAKPINSSSNQVDILICFTKEAIKNNLDTIRRNGILIHQTRRLEMNKDVIGELSDKNVTIFGLNTRKILKDMDAPLVMENSLLLGILFNTLGLDVGYLKNIFKDKLKRKPHLIEKNESVIDKGYQTEHNIVLPQRVEELLSKKSQTDIKKDMLITGNHALVLGSLNAGMRAYYAYPMTPASSILSYLAATYKEHGAVVKQAEDEISAAQMVIGSMHAGTRSMVATSGGGFDLMTETLSLSAITEIPFVCIVAQRPGPATGLPTWTGQGDLNLAIYSGHGEYTRCVIAVSDPKSAFVQIQHAFNIAEKFQIPVLVLTDKHIAESIYLVDDFDTSIKIERHIVDGKKVDKDESIERYQITDSGVSPRWIPGSSVRTYDANGDEHWTMGELTEKASKAKQMIDKRLRKTSALLADLPEPEYFGPKDANTVFVGWGSTKWMVLDVLNNEELKNSKIGYLHFEYVYPLHTEKLEGLSRAGKNLVVIEQNKTGQLDQLIKSTGANINTTGTILKYDGRPFFNEEILDIVNNLV